VGPKKQKSSYQDGKAGAPFEKEDQTKRRRRFESWQTVRVTVRKDGKYKKKGTNKGLEKRRTLCGKKGGLKTLVRKSEKKKFGTMDSKSHQRLRAAWDVGSDYISSCRDFGREGRGGGGRCQERRGRRR